MKEYEGIRNFWCPQEIDAGGGQETGNLFEGA